jgi:hypothetical protein
MGAREGGREALLGREPKSALGFEEIDRRRLRGSVSHDEVEDGIEEGP